MFGTSAHRRIAAACAALCVGALGGCVEERTFFIIQNQVAVASDDGVCVGGSTDTEYRPLGVLDVSAGQGYLMFPLLRLDIESSTANAPGPERNQFALRAYRVNLNLSDIPGSFESKLTSFEQPTSGMLKPGTSLVGTLKVIKDQLAQQIQLLQMPPTARPTVTAKLQAVAVRLGTDSELESTTFHYPVEICNGCLVSMETVCPDKVVVEEGAVAPEWKSNACGMPQDTPATCCPENGAVRCLQGSSGGT